MVELKARVGLPKIDRKVDQVDPHMENLLETMPRSSGSRDHDIPGLKVSTCSYHLPRALDAAYAAKEDSQGTPTRWSTVKNTQNPLYQKRGKRIRPPFSGRDPNRDPTTPFAEPILWRSMAAPLWLPLWPLRLDGGSSGSGGHRCSRCSN